MQLALAGIASKVKSCLGGETSKKRDADIVFS